MLREYIQRTQLGRTIRTIRAGLRPEPAMETEGGCPDGLHCGELCQKMESDPDGQGSQPNPR